MQVSEIVDESVRNTLMQVQHIFVHTSAVQCDLPSSSSLKRLQIFKNYVIYWTTQLFLTAMIME